MCLWLATDNKHFYVFLEHTVNSPIRAQCAQPEQRCALIWKVEIKSFPTVYDNPILTLYRHVIYRWKALGLNFNLQRRGAPLLGVRSNWRIYGICVLRKHILVCKFKSIKNTATWVWKTQKCGFQKQNRHIRCFFVFIFKHLFFLCMGLFFLPHRPTEKTLYEKSAIKGIIRLLSNVGEGISVTDRQTREDMPIT